MANILRSSGRVADFARGLMEAAGLPLVGADGKPALPDWFPLDENLRILDGIGRTFGDAAVFEIGSSVPEHAKFPPAVRDLRQALETLDAAFHSNHRRDGAVMYDPAAGSVLEGIGHYRCASAGSGRLIIDSTSCYPCSFDLGLVSGLAARFDGAAKVQHPPEGPCRRRGADRCGYLVFW